MKKYFFVCLTSVHKISLKRRLQRKALATYGSICFLAQSNRNIVIFNKETKRAFYITDVIMFYIKQHPICIHLHFLP